MVSLFLSYLVTWYGLDRSYQVLCECWMRRTDLPIGYDGWQVMGFSPVHPLGPLPVKAVREKQNRKMFGSDISMLLAMLHSEVCNT